MSGEAQGITQEQFNEAIATAVAAATKDANDKIAEALKKVEAAEQKAADAEAQIADAVRDRQVALHAARSLNPASASFSASTDFPRVKIVVAETGSETDTPDADVFVNGRGYKIKRGEVAEVPPEVVEVLENAVGAKVKLLGEGQMTVTPTKRFPFQIVDQESHRNYEAWKQFRVDARKGE